MQRSCRRLVLAILLRFRSLRALTAWLCYFLTEVFPPGYHRSCKRVRCCLILLLACTFYGCVVFTNTWFGTLFFQVCNSLEVILPLPPVCCRSGEQWITHFTFERNHFYYKIKLVNFYTESLYFNTVEIDFPNFTWELPNFFWTTACFCPGGYIDPFGSVFICCRHSENRPRQVRDVSLLRYEIKYY